MAYNVFGEPIETGNLEDRAREAFENQTVGGKKKQATSYLTQRNGNSSQLSTLGIFYNATGNPVTLNPSGGNSKHGKIDDGGYPFTVKNGQWGAFRHVENEGSDTGSEAYVVYDLKVDDKKDCKSLMAWYTLESTTSKQLVYCDIYDGADPHPSDVYKKMEGNNLKQDSKTGFGLTVEVKSTINPPNEQESAVKDVVSKKMPVWYEGKFYRKNSTDPQDVVGAQPST